jgi:hypothetical protein
MTITIEEILRGVGLGRVQSVGHMGVIPLVDEDGSAQDDSFAPPDVGVDNRNYGSVNIHNEADRPTIVPTGAGWITKRAAQDHAIAGALILKPKSKKLVNTAMCIESTQGGYMVKGDHEMIILPAALRAPALAMRGTQEYGKLWNSIGQMHTTYTGAQSRRQHMTDFLKYFGKELDEFVAQFELVPNQVGAIVLIGDRIVGIERAPNVDFWTQVWSPLIRVCYGTLAARARQVLGTSVPQHRSSLRLATRSLAGLAQALEAAKQETQRLVQENVDRVMGWQLQDGGRAEQQLDGYEVVTLASDHVAGQIVRRGVKVPYASLCRPYEPKHEGI